MSEGRSTALPSPAQILEAVKMLSKQYEDNSEANRELAREVKRRKRETRWLTLGAAIVLAIVVVGGLVVRHIDLGREKDRRELLASQIFTQRDNLLAGCERANDGRRVDRETIEIAFEPAPIPTGLSPELTEFIRQNQQRAAAKREELLSRPGLQLIDCQAAYPPPEINIGSGK